MWERLLWLWQSQDEKINSIFHSGGGGGEYAAEIFSHSQNARRLHDRAMIAEVIRAKEQHTTKKSKSEYFVSWKLHFCCCCCFVSFLMCGGIERFEICEVCVCVCICPKYRLSAMNKTPQTQENSAKSIWNQNIIVAGSDIHTDTWRILLCRAIIIDFSPGKERIEEIARERAWKHERKKQKKKERAPKTDRLYKENPENTNEKKIGFISIFITCDTNGKKHWIGW